VADYLPLIDILFQWFAIKFVRRPTHLLDSSGDGILPVSAA
jgi:hypothetical protein